MIRSLHSPASQVSGVKSSIEPPGGLSAVTAFAPVSSRRFCSDDGARVADVGGLHGISTIVMAEAFRNSDFVGYDFYECSILHATDLAAKQGVADNCRFEVALAKNFPGEDYDLICTFDCLHDMGDSMGAAAHTHKALKPDGV